MAQGETHGPDEAVATAPTTVTPRAGADADPTTYVMHRRLDPLAPGDPGELGGYTLLQRLPGGGRDAGVFLARPSAEPDGTPVVLKVLPSSATATTRVRFEREVANAERVRSPRVARVLGRGEAVDGDPHAGLAWMVQEYAHGASLQEVLREQPSGHLDADDAYRLAIGLLEALGDTHAAGVLHRDIKPGNVILGPRGPVLVDFGISHHTDDRGLTGTVHAVGTVRYMAPEQLRQDSVLDEAVDVFAWGVTVAEASSGHHPFDPDGSLGPVALLRVMETGRPDLRGVPPQLRAAVAQALRPRSESRASLAEVRRALETVPLTRTQTAVVPLTRPALSGLTHVDDLRSRLLPAYQRLRTAVAGGHLAFLGLCLLAVVLALPTGVVLAVLWTAFT